MHPDTSTLRSTEPSNGRPARGSTLLRGWYVLDRGIVAVSALATAFLVALYSLQRGVVTGGVETYVSPPRWVMCGASVHPANCHAHLAATLPTGSPDLQLLVQYRLLVANYVLWEPVAAMLTIAVVAGVLFHLYIVRWRECREPEVVG